MAGDAGDRVPRRRAGAVQPHRRACRCRRSPRSTATASAAGSSWRWRARIASPRTTASIYIGLPEIKLGLLPAWGGTTRLPRLIGLPQARCRSCWPARRCRRARRRRRARSTKSCAPKRCCAAAKRRRDARRSRRKPALPLTTARCTAAAPRDRVLAAAGRQTLEQTLRQLSRADAAARRRARRLRPRHRRRASRPSAQALLELMDADACRNLMRLFFLRQGAKKRAAEQVARQAARSEARRGDRRRDDGRRDRPRAGPRRHSACAWSRSTPGRCRGARPHARRCSTTTSPPAGSTSSRRAMRSTASRRRPSGRAWSWPTSSSKRSSKRWKPSARSSRSSTASRGPTACWRRNTSSLRVARDGRRRRSHPSASSACTSSTPSPKMPLVEVVRDAAERRRVAGDRRRARPRKIGKTPVLVNDAPGFLVNRILIPYLAEALVDGRRRRADRRRSTRR